MKHDWKTTLFVFKILGVILIVVCAYEKSIDYTAANNFIGGIITCGILLLIASLMGIIGSMQHNKFLLFSVRSIFKPDLF
jgi:hypothetical protein